MVIVDCVFFKCELPEKTQSLSRTKKCSFNVFKVDCNFCLKVLITFSLNL